MRAQVDHYNNTDDVYNDCFLENVIFYGGGEDDFELLEETRDYLGQLGNKRINFHRWPEVLEPGPYIIMEGIGLNIWKLVADDHGTCMTTLKPRSE